MTQMRLVALTESRHVDDNPQAGEGEEDYVPG